jgi:hypothetical protein
MTITVLVLLYAAVHIPELPAAVHIPEHAVAYAYPRSFNLINLPCVLLHGGTSIVYDICRNKHVIGTIEQSLSVSQ